MQASSPQAVTHEAETPVFWSSDVNSWLIGEVPDARKDWRQKEKMVLEAEMAGWHHPCNQNEFGQTLEMMRDRKAWRAAVHGVTKSQILDMTRRLNKNNLSFNVHRISSDVSAFISDTVLFILSYFLSLLEVFFFLIFINLSKEPDFSFISFLYWFCFQFCWFLF